MANAVFIIPKASLLVTAINIVEDIFKEIEKDATEGGTCFSGRYAHCKAHKTPTQSQPCKELKMPTHSPPTPADKYLSTLIQHISNKPLLNAKPTHHPKDRILRGKSLFPLTQVTGCFYCTNPYI